MRNACLANCVARFLRVRDLADSMATDAITIIVRVVPLPTEVRYGIRETSGGERA